MYEWKKRTPQAGKCACTCGTQAIGVNAELRTGNVGYPGYLGMGCQHDGIELRHQFFTLGESQSQNYVSGRVDALVRNQAMRSYMLTSTTPSNLVCPPGIETEPTGMRNASTFSTFGVR